MNALNHSARRRVEDWRTLSKKDLLSILARQEGVRKFGLSQRASASTATIFLCYAQPDKPRVIDLYHKLSTDGFKPWMDQEDILPGQKWESAIKRAIRQSDFFVACLSSNSVNRRGFLQKEIRTALGILDEMLDDDIYLVPARLENCSIPEPLIHLQWVDLFASNGYEKLVRSLYEGLSKRDKAIP